MESVPQQLCNIVNKKYLIFCDRGNKAIKLILQVLKEDKYEQIIIQDQGGWMTYPQFISKFEFEKSELKTDYGVVNPKDLVDYKTKKNAILINSMPGYAALQDMEMICESGKENNILVINDVSGSIGTDEAEFGDIVFGSFGNAKPINLGSGGFIATDDGELYKRICELNIFDVNDFFLDDLENKLDSLTHRLVFLKEKRAEVLQDLGEYDIIHPDGNGINVIVKFNNESIKNDIIKYCIEHSFEYTTCPRYIRVNCDAISIELKRLKEDIEDLDIDEFLDIDEDSDKNANSDNTGNFTISEEYDEVD